MISFRYHIVSIVSVFLALAIGIALGGGPLKGEVDNSLVKQVAKDKERKAKLQSEISDLRAQSRFHDAFARGAAPRILGGRLTGRPVALMVLPGAEESAVTDATQLVGEAGGSVAGTYRVGADLVDPAKKQLVDELGSQLLDSTQDLSLPSDVTGYERIGALIARAVATPEDNGADVDGAAGGILSGLDTANLMSSTGDPSNRASLVLVIGGGGHGDSAQQQGEDAIVTSVVSAIDDRCDGVVVTGPAGSADGNGILKAIRDDVATAKDVSTVDSVNDAVGAVVAVLALAQQASGDTGHYGAVDASDGAMPGAAKSGTGG